MLGDIICPVGKGTELHEKNILSVDGNESQGSKRKDSSQGGAKPLQALNVYPSDYGICLAQEFVDEKTNEIPAVQEILKLINLEGMIVTVDAMNCQKDPVSAIAGSKRDYVLALKGNHSLFCGEVQGFL